MTKSWTRRAGLVMGAALTVAVAMPYVAMAQSDYPNKPIKIVTESAGGAVEVLARLIGEQLTTKQGYPQIVVEPQPGADGTIAARAVSESPADGYTLLMIGAALTTAPQTQQVSYDPLAFKPIAMASSSPHFVFVNPNVPVDSIAELIAYGKEKEGALNYAAGAPGNLTWLEQQLLWKMTDIKATHIAYKGGSEVILGVMRGEADVGATTLGGSLDYIKDGSIRALGVTSPFRVAALPDVPSISEAVPGYSVMGWQALFAPAGTPEAVVAKLHADVNAVLAQPEVAEKIKSMGLEEPPARTPDEIKTFLKTNFDQWAKLMQK